MVKITQWPTGHHRDFVFYGEGSRNHRVAVVEEGLDVALRCIENDLGENRDQGSSATG